MRADLDALKGQQVQQSTSDRLRLKHSQGTLYVQTRTFMNISRSGHTQAVMKTHFQQLFHIVV